MGKIKDFIKTVVDEVFADMPENDAYKKRKEKGQGIDAIFGPHSNFAGYSASDRKALCEQQKLEKDMQVRQKVFMTMINATIAEAKALMAQYGYASTWAALTPTQQDIVLNKTAANMATKQGRLVSPDDKDALRYYYEENIK